jgi:hypothetical protein
VHLHPTALLTQKCFGLAVPPDRLGEIMPICVQVDDAILVEGV